jgi:hypothetical protein
MKKQIIPVERITKRIFMLRGERVMLGQDLAVPYGVAVKALNQAVKRQAARFPADFMFQLSAEEFANLKSQFVTSSWGGLRRAPPYAFTEQGVAVLSSVLNSERAVNVNIAIIRAFVKLRQMIDTNHELAQKFSELERRVGKHDEEIVAILEAIRQLMVPAEKPRREIGFHVRERAARYRARNGR